MKTFSLTGLYEAIRWSLPLNDQAQARIQRTAVRSIVKEGFNPRISIRKFKAHYRGAFNGRPPIAANVIVQSALANDEVWREIEPALTSTGVTVVHLN